MAMGRNLAVHWIHPESLPNAGNQAPPLEISWSGTWPSMGIIGTPSDSDVQPSMRSTDEEDLLLPLH